MEIFGNHIAVTGGGSGLGESVARALAAKGARVTVIDRSAEGAARVATDIGGHALTLDVTDDSAGAALDSAIAIQGPLWGLVNCAGIGGASRIVGRDGPMEFGHIFTNGSGEPDWHLQHAAPCCRADARQHPRRRRRARGDCEHSIRCGL